MDPTSDREPRPDDAERRVSRAPGRYLTAAFWLSARRDRRVRTGEISDRPGVEPASVTEMFRTLDGASLVEYEMRRGVVLTGEGERVARRLAWRRCVVRAFFAARLGTELTAERAYLLGDALPGAGVDRLRDLVDHPCRGACPGAETDSGHCLLPCGP